MSSRSTSAARPSRTSSSPERRLARQTSAFLAALAVPVVGAAWWLVDAAAALSAAIGVGFVALLFGAAAWLLVWSVDRSPGRTVAILVGGVVVRLMLYAAALLGLSRLDWVHRPSLALATAAAVLIALTYEVRALKRAPELFWIDADAGRPTVVPHTTRSTTL
jgi:peptidoglycan/LPS O-acetylase OafA/YrhL